MEGERTMGKLENWDFNELAGRWLSNALNPLEIFEREQIIKCGLTEVEHAFNFKFSIIHIH